MKYEDIKIGDRAELTHKITKEDIDKFVDLTGDNNKLHVDDAYAGRTPYKKVVAHGMLGASFISTIIGTQLPGDGALWYAQNLEFILPVRIGDNITVKAEVINKFDKIKSIELKTEIFNQNVQKVTTGTAHVKIVEQENPSDETDNTKRNKLTALVIGATGGIGKAACLQLAQDGFDIAIHYHRNADEAKSIKEEIIKMGRKAMIVKGDIMSLPDVENITNEVVRNFETITLVVNCATTSVPNIKYYNLNWENIQQQIDIDVRAAFNIQKCLVPVMEKSRYGKIVYITALSIEKPGSERIHYITAKSALHGFMKALALELAPKGIRVNAVSPGMTDTVLIADIPEKTRLLTAAQTPLRNLAKPEDIAGAISFLASSRSDFITGETIRVNGGQTMI
jgi:3-oxoacyl-[acyl-carrier protein] reductase